MKNKTCWLMVAVASLALWTPLSGAQTATPSAGMGKGLYGAIGTNSCLFCHGVNGEGGSVKDAAKLDHPKQWKVYAALGGDAAYKKDPKGFVNKMRHATLNLIQLGAIHHNSNYKADGYNKSLIKPYNAQMLGLGGAPSAKWLKKYKDKGVTPAIAAESVWLHIISLDKDGFFKN